MEKSIKKKKQTQRSTTAVVDGKHEERRVYYCTRCPRSFTKQSGNFAKAKSPLWYHNNMYLPVCNKCLEELYNHYVEVLKNEAEAIRRVCMKFDLYYNRAIVYAAMNSPQPNSLIRKYMIKSNLVQYKGVTYDDTIDEERGIKTHDEEDDLYENTPDEAPKLPSVRAMDRWGEDFGVEEYRFLDNHYKLLLKYVDNDDPLQDSLIKDLCKIKLQQERAMKDNRLDDYADLTTLYHKMMKEAKINVAAVSDTSKDAYGVWLQSIEKYTPAEYFSDKKKYWDFFGIGEYIECHMYRPLKNLLTGSRDRDPEFVVGDDDVG